MIRFLFKVAFWSAVAVSACLIVYALAAMPWVAVAVNWWREGQFGLAGVFSLPLLIYCWQWLNDGLKAAVWRPLFGGLLCLGAGAGVGWELFSIYQFVQHDIARLCALYGWSHEYAVNRVKAAQSLPWIASLVSIGLIGLVNVIVGLFALLSDVPVALKTRRAVPHGKEVSR